MEMLTTLSKGGYTRPCFLSCYGRMEAFSRFDNDRHRSVIDEFDLHIGPETTRRYLDIAGEEALNNGFNERFRHVSRRSRVP